MGGVGIGNWYRFDKKTTTGECHSVDVRYLHRNGLLKAGGWFSLRWSRGEHETGSIGGSVEGHLRLRPERTGERVGRRVGARVPHHLDGVQLRWREAVVRLSRSGLRSESCGAKYFRRTSAPHSDALWEYYISWR
jgi:hypothetical protein